MLDRKKSLDNLDSGGKRLNKTLERTKELMSGTKGGSKAANAAFQQTEYDIARGTAGATGASGRDFANQARGLDGLVRLYATYAANIFAAGAAFRALSDAADTTNMIRGMNQLGAVSGVALGSIAKKLVETTDNAISMREAIEATTKGISAGLSAKQMEELGQVANKASKALGINMPDAISRLTRGISKLEPELLDELGLFTKIGPATENYARSIGKSVASLTDFERRQAFANAVLKEGIDKFNSIDVAANPYDKLLASLKDVSFKALEALNTAFIPLVNILSQNPAALVGVLTAIGLSIVKTAIPALGQYRENLKKTADVNRMAFTQMYKDQQDKISEMADLAGAKAERAFKKLPATLSKVEELTKKGATFSNTQKMDYAKLAGKDPFALTSDEIKSLDARARYLATRNSEEAIRLKAHIAELKAIRAGAAAAGSAVSESVIKNTEGRLTTPGSNDIIQKSTLNKLATDSIRSTVAETQAVYGSRAAYAKLNEEIAKARSGQLKMITHYDEKGVGQIGNAPEMGRIRAEYTRFAGTVGIAVQKVGSLISAFGNVGMAIGAVLASFALLDSWMTKTGKEADAFNKTIQDTSDAVDNTTRTLAVLAKQPGIATASIQGFLALSNASNTTTSSVELQLDATKNLLTALNSSLWDRAKDNIASLFGKDVNSESANKLARTVQSQLQIFRAAGMGDEAEAGFKKAIGVNSLDLDTIAERFKNSTDAQDDFAKSNKGLDVRLKESSTKLQDFKTSTEAVTKAYDEFIQSTASNNPLFKIGAALEDLSLSMDKLTSGSLKEMNAAFNDLANNPKKVGQFGPEFVAQFVALRGEFKTTLEEYSAYEQSLANIQDEIDKKVQQRKDAKDPIRVFSPVGARGATGPTAEQQKDKLTTEIDLLGASKKTVKDLQLGIDIEVFGKARDLFITGISASFAKGSELIAKALGQSAEKAALAVAQAGVGALTGARAAQETTRLKQEEIKIQMSQIDSTIQLITSNTLLTATMNESNARMALAQADKDKAPAIVLEFKRAEVKAAEIFKNAMDDVAKGKLKTSDLGSIAQTEDPAVNASLRASIIKVQRETAAQTASKIELGGKSQANVIEGERALALARLEDLNKQRNLQNDINQQLITREDILAGIDTLNAAQRVQEKIRLENLNLDTKQLQEIEGYTTAIANAERLGTDKGQEEAKRQEELLLKVRERQKIETDNKGVADRLKLKTTEFEVATKLNALNETILDQDIARLGIISNLIGFTSEQNVLATTRLENEKLENKFALERKKIEEELKQFQDDRTKDNTKSIALKQVELQLVTDRQEKEKDNKGLQDALKLVQSRFDLEQKLAGFRKTIADAQSQQTEDELNYRRELGLVTNEQFAKEKANLDRGKVARETAQEQAEIDKKIADKNLLRDKLAQIDPGDLANPEDIINYLKMNDVIVAQSAALQATNQQKMNAIDLTERLADRMTGFSKIVESGFQSMADALADFARTGKLDFKGLIDSMLVDLIRFELRAQMSLLYSGMGGLGGLFSMFTGGGSQQVSNTSFADMPINGFVAKGGVYDAGIETFAKGGMFTNSIVSEPTLFKFAKGTGMMGEAGPEAIMPLKRDSNGNLGVRSGGGSSVDVVVNNYGSEKATTKETTDSRGNRRIEVIVGDMVAGELSRPGSSVQQSLSNNFGSRPAVARR